VVDRIQTILKLRAKQEAMKAADYAAAAGKAGQQKKRADHVRAELPNTIAALRSAAARVNEDLGPGNIALQVTAGAGRDDVLSDIEVALSLQADQPDPFEVTTPFPLRIRIGVDGTTKLSGPGLDGREEPRRQREFQIEQLDRIKLEDLLLVFVEAAVVARGDPEKREQQARLMET
jgi:hypothetical protein